MSAEYQRLLDLGSKIVWVKSNRKLDSMAAVYILSLILILLLVKPGLIRLYVAVCLVLK